MRLAISGWRGMSSKEYLHVFQQAMEDLIVITGGAKGADAFG
jgi:hypothetical protein